MERTNIKLLQSAVSKQRSTAARVIDMTRVNLAQAQKLTVTQMHLQNPGLINHCRRHLLRTEIAPLRCTKYSPTTTITKIAPNVIILTDILQVSKLIASNLVKTK